MVLAAIGSLQKPSPFAELTFPLPSIAQASKEIQR